MRKAEVYVETSVWGAAAETDPTYFRRAAETLLGSASQFEFFISPVVLEEIENAPPEVNEIIALALKRAAPSVLEADFEIERLANEYVTRGVIPPKYHNDALHVAYATFYGKDFLVSYNFKHIVGIRRRNLIKAANVVLGYSTPEIVSPEELVEE